MFLLFSDSNLQKNYYTFLFFTILALLKTPIFLRTKILKVIFFAWKFKLGTFWEILKILVTTKSKKSYTFASLLLLRKHLKKKPVCMFCAVVGIYRLVGKCSWAKNSFGKTLSSFWSPLELKERLWEQKKALKGSWAKNAPNMSWDTAGTGFSLNYSSRNTVKKFSSQLLFANRCFIVSINRRCEGLATEVADPTQKIIIQCRKCNHEPGDLGLGQVGTKYRWLT